MCTRWHQSRLSDNIFPSLQTLVKIHIFFVFLSCIASIVIGNIHLVLIMLVGLFPVWTDPQHCVLIYAQSCVYYDTQIIYIIIILKKQQTNMV